MDEGQYFLRLRKLKYWLMFLLFDFFFCSLCIFTFDLICLLDDLTALAADRSLSYIFALHMTLDAFAETPHFETLFFVSIYFLCTDSFLFVSGFIQFLLSNRTCFMGLYSNELDFFSCYFFTKRKVEVGAESLNECVLIT